MNRLPKGLLTGLLAVTLLGAAIITIPEDAAATTTYPTVKFGMGLGSSAAQTKAGVKPDYEAFWVGPWTLNTGWGDPNAQMDSLRAQGVTPAIHYYYWGDDITPTCVENGCWSNLHGTWKNKAGWQKLADQLVYNLNVHMKGEPVLIFMETEFNKGGVEDYEAFDGYLADKANHIKKGYPQATIVMALGNWNSAAWSKFDRIAAASDIVGIQGMRGSTRDSLSSYQNLYEATLSGLKTARTLFGKPTMVHDLALSTYPEPGYLTYQAAELKQFFTGMDALQGAGMRALIYRSWHDDPHMDLANYYGQAERHWGFAYGSGSYKASAKVWVDGVKSERGSTSATSAFTADFAPSKNINEWWVDVNVKGSGTVSKVSVSVNGGSYTALSKNSWGGWSKSMHVAKGSKVVFLATDAYGNKATSPSYTWLSTSSTTTASTFTASFSPSSSINEWWVDVTVKSSNTVSKVAVSVNGGAYTALSKNSWGGWSKSMYVAKGSTVVFRATDPGGNVASSQSITWLGSATALSATFTPKSVGKDWWIETAVSANQKLVRVDACINSKCSQLPKTSWGTYAKSIHAPDGTKVTFKATSGDGGTVSKTYVW